METHSAHLVHRLLDNTSDKLAEQRSKLTTFLNEQEEELESFIASHDDTYYEDEDLCPYFGHSLLWNKLVAGEKRK